jgi:hypothetical protein
MLSRQDSAGYLCTLIPEESENLSEKAVSESIKIVIAVTNVSVVANEKAGLSSEGWRVPVTESTRF